MRQISTWLDLLFWRYCHCMILAFWLENAYSGLFLQFWGILTPWNCDIIVLTPPPPPKGMQYFQKHAFWNITRQNRSSGLTPCCAKEQIRKHRPLTFYPFVGSPPEPIEMPFGLLSGVTNVITHAKFCVNRLRGFSAATSPKVPFPILFRTTLTTVLHYTVQTVISLILTYLLYCTVYKLCLIVGQIFLRDRGCLTLTPSLGVISANISIIDISLKTWFFGLHFSRS